MKIIEIILSEEELGRRVRVRVRGDHISDLGQIPYHGHQDTLGELSKINWIQFYFDPFKHQLKMGHSKNF